MPDVARAARRPAVDAPADDDAAADAGADLDAEEVGDAAGDTGVLLPQRHEVHVVVDEDRAAEFLAERLPYREAVPAGHDRGRHGDALGEADRSGYADAGAVEPFRPPGGPELRRQGQDPLEDRDGALAHVHRLVEVAEDLQFGVGDGDVDGGRADVDAQEAESGVEADVVGAAAAAEAASPSATTRPVSSSRSISTASLDRDSSTRSPSRARELGPPSRNSRSRRA